MAITSVIAQLRTSDVNESIRFYIERIGAVCRRRLALVAIAAAMWLMPSAATAKPCDSPADPGRVTGVSECLVIRAFPSPGELSRPTLVVVLHGDLSAVGPAKYHFAFA